MSHKGSMKESKYIYICIYIYIEREREGERDATYVERKMCDYKLITGATGIATKVLKKNLEAIQ